MKIPRVKHIREDIEEDDVFIGRPSKWGNPFILGVNGDRELVIHKYIQLKGRDKQFIADVIKELKGKNLVCYCSPKKCHGDWLLKIANELE